VGYPMVEPGALMKEKREISPGDSADIKSVHDHRIVGMENCRAAHYGRMQYDFGA
jgi:hypothetical protein